MLLDIVIRYVQFRCGKGIGEVCGVLEILRLGSRPGLLLPGHLILDKLLYANLDKALSDDVKALWDLSRGQNLLT